MSNIETKLAEMSTDIRHICDTLGEIKESLKEINGNLDTTIHDVGVLKDYRTTHGEEHAKLDARVSRNAWVNGIAASVLAGLAALLGLNK